VSSMSVGRFKGAGRGFVGRWPVFGGSDSSANLTDNCSVRVCFEVGGCPDDWSAILYNKPLCLFNITTRIVLNLLIVIMRGEFRFFIV